VQGVQFGWGREVGCSRCGVAGRSVPGSKNGRQGCAVAGISQRIQLGNWLIDSRQCRAVKLPAAGVKSEAPARKLAFEAGPPGEEGGGLGRLML
jgi:hypothetical protein